MADEILTLDDCNIVVKNYLKTEKFLILNINIKQFFDEVNGFLGEHLLLSVEVSVQGVSKQLRFFMKRFPFEHVKQSEFLKSMNGWQREIFFFENFLQDLKNTLPEYQIDFVPEYLLGKPDDLIVFEDLTLKNYAMPRKPSLNLLDKEHICLVLTALAKLHAGSLAFEEYKSKELEKPFRLFQEKDDFAKEPLLRKQPGFLGYDFYNAAIKGLSALINKVYKHNNPTLEKVQQHFSVLSEMALERLFHQKIFRNVLAHGDIWAKNVMFQYKGESSIPLHALLVDFQLFRYHVPAHDVLLFISLTTNQEARKNDFHFYLNYYHNNLKKQLKHVYIDSDEIGMSYEQFLKSVSYIMPEMKIQGPLQRLQQCGNKEFYTKLLNDREAFIKFVFVDKTPFALELFETDANFRSLLTEAIEEIIEAALYPEIFREDCYRILEEDLGNCDYELLDYKVVGQSDRDYMYELEVNIIRNGERYALKYLIRSEPLDFVRVVKKL